MTYSLFSRDLPHFNASVLNERYNYTNKPFTFDWDHILNEIVWI